VYLTTKNVPISNAAGESVRQEIDIRLGAVTLTGLIIVSRPISSSRLVATVNLETLQASADLQCAFNDGGRGICDVVIVLALASPATYTLRWEFSIDPDGILGASLNAAISDGMCASSWSRAQDVQSARL
jgi:hypothetical protein